MARNQQSRGQDLLRGALNLASSYVNKRTELPRAIIPPAVGIGAGVGDFVFDPTRPTIGESTQSGLGTGKAAAELMKYAKFPQLSAPTQAPVGEGTVLLGEGQSPYQPQAPQAQTPVANGQPSSIPLLPPVVTTEQTEMGPVTLEVPVVSPEGAAFMEGVTLPPAGSGTVLQTPQQAGAGTVMQQPLSEQFSQAGVQQGSFIPQQLGAQPAAPTSPQANFESRMATGIPLTDAEIQSATQFGASRGLSFSPETGYTQAPTPAGPTFQGQPLSEYLAGGIQLDPQGRMIDPDVDRSAFEQASEARSMAAGNSIRPGVDVPSLAMQRARMDAGLDPVAGAPMGTEMSQQQQRDMLDRGFDPATGKKIDKELTFEQQIAARRQRLAEDKFKYDVVKEADQAYKAEMDAYNKAKTEEAKSESAGRGMARSVSDMMDVMLRASTRLDKDRATGMIGKGLSAWKGSMADQQEQDFAFLKSNVALNAMMELKRLSPTGSTGFGALNTEELKTLQNQFAALDPFTSPDIVSKNLAQLGKRFKGIVSDAYKEHAAQYGEDAAESVYGEVMKSLNLEGGGRPQQGQAGGSDGATPQMEGFTFKRKN